MFGAIPYFELGVFNIPLPFGREFPIDPWGTLVCIGFVVGMEMARARAIRLGLEVKDIVDGSIFVVLSGFLMGHIFTVLFYYPERLAESGIWAILRFWEGFSSTGGFVGAVLGAMVFFRILRKVPAMRHADVIAYGFPAGWFFGRLGCGVVHDHIGILTNSPLGMLFPPEHYAAGLRHELGLYEAFLMVPMMLLFHFFGKRDQAPGFFMGLFSVLYAPARFGMDFLRNGDLDYHDSRYMGLTPAQIGCIVLFLGGIWLLMSRHQREFQPVTLQAGNETP